MSPTMVLVSFGQGKGVFGGYTALAWRGNPQSWMADPTRSTFVLSLKNMRVNDPFRVDYADRERGSASAMRLVVRAFYAPSFYVLTPPATWTSCRGTYSVGVRIRGFTPMIEGKCGSIELKCGEWVEANVRSWNGRCEDHDAVCCVRAVFPMVDDAGPVRARSSLSLTGAQGASDPPRNPQSVGGGHVDNGDVMARAGKRSRRIGGG
jgi:hypothetical protein